MGWSNGPKTWSELNARLSDGRRPSPGDLNRRADDASGQAPGDPNQPERSVPDDQTSVRDPTARLQVVQPDPSALGVPGRIDPRPPGANAGDSPAWSRKRQAYVAPSRLLTGRNEVSSHDLDATPYAELHCHSNFSFLDGASHPEELVEEAVRLGLTGLALTDHDGLYGVVRFAEAARAHGLPTVFGAELTLHLASSASSRVGEADPHGDHLVVLAADPVGYGRLSRAIAAAHLGAGEKGAPRLLIEQLAAMGEGSTVPFHEALTRGPAPESLVSGDTVLSSLQVTPLHQSVADDAAIRSAAGRHPAAWARQQLRAQITSARNDLQNTDSGHWRILTGCRKGAVPRALVDHGPHAAARELDRLIDVFGRTNVIVELWDHGDPLDSARNDGLAALATRAGVDLIATGNVHYASPARRPLATALAAVRARRSLDDIDPWLPAAAASHLRSGAEMARRLARYPGAVARAAEIARDCAFDLKLVAPNLPPYPCPGGLSEMAFLRRLAEEGAERRYGRRKGAAGTIAGEDSERVPGAYRQIDHELALIEYLGFAGYFLVVWDLVEFCRRSNIFCQGRGSAANSAVCYALGVTNADAVSLGLLFERFLSPERDGPPDIDIDIESDRREEVIQYVYARYGRENAAQVANVITYRARSAVRDMGKALGHAPGQLDAWGKQVDGWGRVRATADDPATDIPASVLALAAEVEDFPRHLGIHSGGMVICDRPVVEVVPVEWGRASIHNDAFLQTDPADPDDEPGDRSGVLSPDTPDSAVLTRCPTPSDRVSVPRPGAPIRRHPSTPSSGTGPLSRRNRVGAGTPATSTPLRTVLQWDKDDCAAAGLVKFDLLGLGMLSALHYGVDLIREFHGTPVELSQIPQEDDVYEMICRADTVGVFQIESRAQMATLPRLQPRAFYDLVVEVALIRPGPIQGGSVHPYIRRRNGLEPVTYLHPLLEKSLKKTLGIPLFQEQLMQMSIDVAGFSPSEADQLRQAMGSKRSSERMERLKARLYEGMRTNSIDEPTCDIIYDKLAAFANYGFPESHSVSFAYLVYASCWMKHHYPAAFCAALLQAQPMGFYSPQSLTADARRHGVVTLAPNIQHSEVRATCEWAVGVGERLPAPFSDAAPLASLDCSQHEWPDGVGERLPQSMGANHLPTSLGGVLPQHMGATSLPTAGTDERGYPTVQPAVRLGLAEVRHVGTALAEHIVAARGDAPGAGFAGLTDFVQRVSLRLGAPVPKLALEALATAGAFESFGLDRRRALWAAGALATAGADRLDGIVTGIDAPALPGMSVGETMASDLWATGVTPGTHPMLLVRDRLAAQGVLASDRLREVPHGTRIRVAGIVTHRQRPQTAGGTTFLNLEDESGLINIVCSKGLWDRSKRVARGAPALIVRGILERTETPSNSAALLRSAPLLATSILTPHQVLSVETRLARVSGDGTNDQNMETPGPPGVVLNLIADRIELLTLEVSPGPSRDFR